jgi:hypothetical protein
MRLGPKLIMIRAIGWKTVEFFFVIFAFMFAFGVSTQGLMYHNMPLDLELVKNMFLPAFWVIGGEYINVDNMLAVDSCQINDISRYDTDQYSYDDCMDKNGTPIALGIYVLYIIVLLILLVNLLIAIFTNTFEEIEAESDKIWRFQRYTLIYEYYHKTIFVPPFSSIYYLYVFTVKAGLMALRKTSFFKKLKLSKQNTLVKLFFYLSQKYRNGFSKKRTFYEFLHF